MLKLLKWDLINLVKKYYLLLLGILAANIFFELFFINLHISTLVINDIFAPLYGFYGCYLIWVQLIIFAIALISMSSWLHKSSAPLIASIYSRPWKIIISKLIVTVIASTSVFLLSEIIIQIGCLITNRPNEIVHYANLPTLNYSFILLYCLTMIFSLILAINLKLTRKSPILSAGIIYYLLMRLFAVLYWEKVYSAPLFPEIGITIFLTVLLFASGCLLYKRRFE